MPTERNVFRLCSFGLFRVPSVLLLLLSGFLLLQRVRSSPAGTASVMGRLVNIPNEVDMNPFKVVVRQGGGAGVSGAPRKETFVSRDGGFSVSGLGPSSHLLEVLHPSLVFEPVLLEVLPESQGQNGVKAFSFSYEHGQGAQLRLPLTLVPRGKNSFFEAREEFNIMALGKNYMVWIMLATVGLMLILPKMQESLAAEQAALAEEQQKEQAQQGQTQQEAVDDGGRPGHSGAAGAGAAGRSPSRSGSGGLSATAGGGGGSAAAAAAFLQEEGGGGGGGPRGGHTASQRNRKGRS